MSSMGTALDAMLAATRMAEKLWHSAGQYDDIARRLYVL